MATPMFEAAGFSVGFVVRPATRHAIAFVQFVQKHIATLFFLDVIIHPDFVLWHEFINIVMAAFCKVDIEGTAN